MFGIAKITQYKFHIGCGPREGKKILRLWPQLLNAGYLMPEQLRSWSYSRYSTWKTCPQKAKFAYIDKIVMPGEESAALKRGNEVHKTLESYVQFQNVELPKELHRHKKLLDAFKKHFKTKFVLVEEEWAFNEKWWECDWFGKDAWCRVKMDVCVDAGKKIHGYDHKTGKFRPGQYNDQMLLYCVAMLLKFPDADTAFIELLFYDCDAPPVKAFLKRMYLEQTLKKIESMVEPMLRDTTFEPKTGPLCGFCEYSKKRGGPCQAA